MLSWSCKGKQPTVQATEQRLDLRLHLFAGFGRASSIYDDPPLTKCSSVGTSVSFLHFRLRPESRGERHNVWEQLKSITDSEIESTWSLQTELLSTKAHPKMWLSLHKLIQNHNTDQRHDPDPISYNWCDWFGCKMTGVTMDARFGLPLGFSFYFFITCMKNVFYLRYLLFMKRKGQWFFVYVSSNRFSIGIWTFVLFSCNNLLKFSEHSPQGREA